LCCVHGQPYATVSWCGWCADVASGHADSPFLTEPMWLCPHGIGEDIGEDIGEKPFQRPQRGAP
jgi:hypothetical protein